jgi:transcriptional regulator
MTDTHEAPRDVPWAVTDAPADFVDQMLGAIIGFKLVVTRLEGKWKMSQNRPRQDVAGVIEGLTREDGESQEAVAEIVASRARR